MYAHFDRTFLIETGFTYRYHLRLLSWKKLVQVAHGLSFLHHQIIVSDLSGFQCKVPSLQARELLKEKLIDAITWYHFKFCQYAIHCTEQV
jgi:hypothetical protein